MLQSEGIHSGLRDAAQQFDGGLRSFPAASDKRFNDAYGYDPPNEDYQDLFSRQATVSSSQRETQSILYSAGWLIPDDFSVCKPVFVAHSVLSASWLLRETLTEDALPSTGWEKLVYAAQRLADNASEPPSAQQPREPPSRLSKRAALFALLLPSERLRLAQRRLARPPRSHPSPARVRTSPQHSLP